MWKPTGTEENFFWVVQIEIQNEAKVLAEFFDQIKETWVHSYE